MISSSLVSVFSAHLWRILKAIVLIINKRAAETIKIIMGNNRCSNLEIINAHLSVYETL
jgi:hypothetical protein